MTIPDSILTKVQFDKFTVVIKRYSLVYCCFRDDIHKLIKTRKSWFTFTSQLYKKVGLQKQQNQKQSVYNFITREQILHKLVKTSQFAFTPKQEKLVP